LTSFNGRQARITSGAGANRSLHPEGQPMLTKIVSGGQTGVDRAALDLALELGFPCGGWCPKGRKAEDGPLPAHYPLIEIPTNICAVRTKWNVRDSDGTLLLVRGPLTCGSKLTADVAVRERRPVLVFDLPEDSGPDAIRLWLDLHSILVLNVAGPRESGAPGIYAHAKAILRQVLAKPGVLAP
jgi:hypothetical protein